MKKKVPAPKKAPAKKPVASKAKPAPAKKPVVAKKAPPKSKTPAPKKIEKPVKVSGNHAKTGKSVEIAALDGDPESGLKGGKRSAATLSLGPLPLQILGTAVKPGIYSPGTANFRYWSAADALRRARDVWKAHLPEGVQWQGGATLDVNLDAGEDLNAYYDRKTLSFYRGNVKGKDIYTADSPDVVAHELGHAVLDALRPDLWDAALDEVAAFHESFSDITALLSAMQLDSVASAVIKETGGLLYQNSSLSRVAEQYGKAVFLLNPNAAPPDCLRNAVNSFFYQEPMHLPPMASHSQLSSEPHSFSRVFTAGFFEAVAGMLKVHAPTSPKAADVQAVARDAAALLARAVRSAALSAAFYSEVAAQVIWADAPLFNGKYEDVLRSAFVRRGLLSLEAVRSLRAEAARAIASGKPNQPGDEMPRGRDMMMRASAYGLGEGALVVRTASFSRRGMIAPAAPDAGSTPVPGVEQATQSFLETLFRRGRVDFSQCKAGLSSVPHTHVKRKTHYLVEQNGQYHLRRRCFDEGFDW